MPEGAEGETASEAVWRAAYLWLCRQRRSAPDNAEVWHLRFHWRRDGKSLLRRVQQGHYRLSPMQLVHCRNGESLAMWGAQDALVLKWVALRAAKHLPAHDLCHHLKGRGSRHSVNMVATALREDKYRFVYRSDIRGYYQHMRKDKLVALVQHWLLDPVLCDLVLQFIHYSVEDCGEFHTPESGISRGCALSPMLGASLLYHVDAAFAAGKAVFYVRYMDDFLLLSQTRWALRRAIRRLHQFMQPQGFAMHPDKTQLGRIANGFDWLGIWFGPEGPGIAPRALNNHRQRRLRLYEQARHRGLSESAARERVRAYEMRWNNWVRRYLCAAQFILMEGK